MLKKRAGLNSFALKLIASASMLVDHTGAMLFPDVMWLRFIGRLAFPIYAFMLCEGFLHTRNVKRYAVRLGIFAAISEVPYNLLHSYRIFDLDAQNVFLTLLIGLITLFAISKLDGGAEATPGQRRALNKRQLAAMLCGMAAAQLLRTDYGAFGVAVIMIFFLFRGRRARMLCIFAASNVIMGPVQILAGAAAAPILLYNGKKGPSAKYLFYAFYPAHILALAAIKYFILNIPLNM